MLTYRRIDLGQIHHDRAVVCVNSQVRIGVGATVAEANIRALRAVVPLEVAKKFRLWPNFKAYCRNRNV